MIRRVLALLLLLAAPVAAEEQFTFTHAYDLATPTVAATTNYIVASVNLTNTTFTLAHQPDVPRNVTIAVTDTTPSITAGTITVTGLDVNGSTITEVLDLSTGLTLTGTKVFASISSAVSAGATTLGGAGDETIIVGVGSVVGYSYCSTIPGTGAFNIKTSGSSATVTAATSGQSPFARLAAGDRIFVTVAGAVLDRTISTWTNGASVVVDSAINLSGNGAGGYNFTFADLTCGSADTSGWANVEGMHGKTLFVDILALSATGGVDYSVECRGSGELTRPYQVLSGNLTAARVAAVPSALSTITQLIPERCSAIRVGLKFGTVDTAGADSIDVAVRSEK